MRKRIHIVLSRVANRHFSHLGRVRTDRLVHALFRDLIVRAISASSLYRVVRWMKLRSFTPDDELKPYRVVESKFVGKRVVIYAHYHVAGLVTDHDLKALQTYKTANYSVIVVSTSSWPASVKHDADVILVRENVGYDFGSWAAGINYLRAEGLFEEIEHLVLVNNSMFGPFWDVSEFLLMARNSGEVVGLTGSREFVHHMQSYFLSFQGRVLLSQAFEEFWLQSFHHKRKWGIILSGELMWDYFFELKGFQSNRVLTSCGNVRRNELTFYWRELIAKGFPYVKKSLFTHNYDDIDLSNWESLMNTYAPDFDLVDAVDELSIHSSES